MVMNSRRSVLSMLLGVPVLSRILKKASPQPGVDLAKGGPRLRAQNVRTGEWLVREDGIYRVRAEK